MMKNKFMVVSFILVFEATFLLKSATSARDVLIAFPLSVIGLIVLFNSERLNEKKRVR
ncbi:hypothetical protein [Listeria booriae]|nr:hypothetical protein [Listeria booriae]MBC2306556.1 hypothetical protein [Listeria booriae]